MYVCVCVCKFAIQYIADICAKAIRVTHVSFARDREMYARAYEIVRALDASQRYMRDMH